MGFSDTFSSIVSGADSILNVALSPVKMAGGLLGGAAGATGLLGATGPAAAAGATGPVGTTGGAGLVGAVNPFGMGAGGGTLATGGPIAPFIQRLLGIGAGAATGSGAKGAATGAASGVLGSVLGWLGMEWIFGQGNAPAQGIGKPRMKTIVYAVYENGFIEPRSEEWGTPYLMSRDMQRARRVNRLIRKADARLPKKTVKQSKSAQLTEAVQETALAQITAGMVRPNHHHCHG